MAARWPNWLKRRSHKTKSQSVVTGDKISTDLSSEEPTARADVEFRLGAHSQKGAGIGIGVKNDRQSVRLATRALVFVGMTLGFALVAHFIGASVMIGLIAGVVGGVSALVLIYTTNSRQG